MSPSDLSRLFDQLTLTINDFGRQWGVRNRHRVRGWLQGDIEAPPWFANALLSIKALVAVKANLEAARDRGERVPWLDAEIEVIAGMLDQLAGKRFDPPRRQREPELPLNPPQDS